MRACPYGRRRPHSALLALGLALLTLRPATVHAIETAALCDRAAAVAAADTGVPLSLLRALTRTETGRTRDGVFGPWPWTVNHAGDGRWFADREGARAFAEARFGAGARNLDIGCFQINLRWHGHAFASLDEMFDPARNARYAADFLTSLHREFGTWDAAVAAFHSRTPQFAARYMDRFDRIHAALLSDDPDAAERETGRRTGPPQMPRALDLGPRPSLLTEAGGAALVPAARAGLFGQATARPLWEDRP